MINRISPKSKREITYPYKLKKFGHTVIVYRNEKQGRGSVYVVTYYRGGKRVRETYSDEEKALRHADTAVNATPIGKGASLALGPAELESYHLAKGILAKLEKPLPLHVVAEEFYQATKRLGNVSLLRAVDQYLADAKEANLKPITVPALVKEFIRAKQADGLSTRYIKDCEVRLGRFGRDFQVPITSVKTADIDVWLRALMQSPRSRNNFRVLIVTLFSYARSAGYLPKDRLTEATDVARAKDKGGDIQIFTPDELSRLLASAGNAVMPYLALGAFAGIRTAEQLRLTWDCIRFDRKVIEVKAGMAKTMQRRLVPLSNNLALWLRRVAKPSGPVLTLARPEKTAAEVVGAMCDPVIPWKRNGLRHSYASYRLAILKDAGKLALEMGNSPSMIFSNYRELVAEEDANQWFALVPKTDDKDKKDTEVKEEAIEGKAVKVESVALG